MRKKSATEVLAENLRTLMDSDPNLDSDRKLAKVAGVSHKTINNILQKRHDVLISNVEKLARAFRIETHQLICPIPDRSFLTICQAYSSTDVRGRDFLAATAETVMRTNAAIRTATKSGET